MGSPRGGALAPRASPALAPKSMATHERSYADLEAELDAILAEDEDAVSSSQDEDDTAQASPLPSPPLLATDANVPPPPLPPLPPLPPIDYESEAHRQLLEHCKRLDEVEPPRSPAAGGLRCPAAEKEREAAQVEAARQAAVKRAAA